MILNIILYYYCCNRALVSFYKPCQYNIHNNVKQNVTVLPHSLQSYKITQSSKLSKNATKHEKSHLVVLQR